MINLETLDGISERQKQAMLAHDKDKTSTQFKGAHMLFTGDFYQLRPVTAAGLN